MAFALAGILMWFIVIKKLKKSYFKKLSLGASIALFIGFISDIIFYKKLVFTPWNYFERALIIPKDLSLAGEPWHYYFSELWDYLTPIFAAVLFFSLAIVITLNRKKWIVFVIIPFLFFHSLFEHKEIRFIFPIAFLTPYMIFLGIDNFSKHLFPKKKYAFYGIFFLLMIPNAFGLFFNMQKAAGNCHGEMIRFLLKEYNNKEVTMIYTSWANPFDPWSGLQAHFYKPINFTFKKVKDACSINEFHSEKKSTILYLTRSIEYEKDPCIMDLLKQGFNFKKQSMSELTKAVAKNYSGLNLHANLILLELKPKKTKAKPSIQSESIKH